MKRRGTAIIIALLLVTIASSVAFGIGQLMVLESGSVTAQQKGILAYYAAESGIEEAFLHYRYERGVNQTSGQKIVSGGAQADESPSIDAEVPVCPDQSDPLNKCDWQPVATAAKPFKATRVSFGQSATTTQSSILAGSAVVASATTPQVYDLRMGSRSHYLGDPVAGYGDGVLDQSPNDVDRNLTQIKADETASNYIIRDESKKYTIKQATDAVKTYPEIFFRVNKDMSRLSPYSLATDDNGSDKTCSVLEIKLTGHRLSGTTFPLEQTKGLFINPDCYQSYVGKGIIVDHRIVNPATGNKTISADGDKGDNGDRSGGVYYYKEPRSTPSTETDRNYYVFSPMAALWSGAAIYDAELSIKPIYTDIALQMYSKTDFLEGAFTKIESTGYYGGIARKLTADIDRQSGTLYDLFDYVIYARDSRDPRVDLNGGDVAKCQAIPANQPFCWGPNQPTRNSQALCQANTTTNELAICNDAKVPMCSSNGNVTCQTSPVTISACAVGTPVCTKIGASQTYSAKCLDVTNPSALANPTSLPACPTPQCAPDGTFSCES